jgi:hypothetical protein
MKVLDKVNLLQSNLHSMLTCCHHCWWSWTRPKAHPLWIPLQVSQVMAWKLQSIWVIYVLVHYCSKLLIKLFARSQTYPLCIPQPHCKVTPKCFFLIMRSRSIGMLNIIEQIKYLWKTIWYNKSCRNLRRDDILGVDMHFRTKRHLHSYWFECTKIWCA